MGIKPKPKKTENGMFKVEVISVGQKEYFV